jgi:hypothetical protein
MLNTSVVLALRTFTEAELNSFGEFLLSPFFNKKKTVTRLYEHIRKFSPAFDSDKLERQALWKSIYKGKEFNYGVMKNLIYDLGKLIERYLQVARFERTEFARLENLAWEYIDRNLSGHAEKQLKLLEEVAVHGGKDTEVFKRQLEVTCIREYLASQLRNPKYHKESRNEECIDKHTLYYVSAVAERYYNVLLNKEFVTGIRDNERHLEFIEMMKRHLQLDEVMIGLHVNNLMLLIEPDTESHYFESKSHLLSVIDDLSIRFRYKMILALINHNNRMILRGNVKYNREILELIKLMIEKNALVEKPDDWLNHFLYVIAVSSACNEKEFAWAENFIESYKDKVLPEFREQYYYYALTTLNMKKKKFDLALDNLSRIKSASIMDKVTIKRFELMIFYESGYIEQFHSFLDSFISFRNKDRQLSEQAKQLISNFIYFIRKIGQFRFNMIESAVAEADINSLRKELIQSEVINKSWLIEKLEEMKMEN